MIIMVGVYSAKESLWVEFSSLGKVLSHAFNLYQEMSLVNTNGNVLTADSSVAMFLNMLDTILETGAPLDLVALADLSGPLACFLALADFCGVFGFCFFELIVVCLYLN